MIFVDTSDYVVDEILTLLKMRGEYSPFRRVYAFE
jgi:hypothetical protein